MKKKILFVNSSLNTGGSEKVMTLIANELSTRGYDVTMVLLREKGKDVYKINKAIRCVRFSYKYKNKIYKAWKRYKKLRHAVKETAPDYVISFMIDINILVLLCCLGLNIPVIVSERCDPNQFGRWVRIIEKMSYKKAQNVVFQTEYIKEQYPAFIREKAVVIFNPVPSRLPERQSEAAKVIVSAGRLTEQKNHKLLIRAFARFHKIYPEYNLIIYGEGEERASLRELTQELEVANSVTFPGFVENVDDEMKDAMMYISSSDFEGISNSMLEAICIGIPTIATDCPIGGSRTVIKNNSNGILIKVNSEEELLKAMVQIVENVDFRKKISDEGKKTRNKYSITTIVDEWEKLLA